MNFYFTNENLLLAVRSELIASLWSRYVKINRICNNAYYLYHGDNEKAALDHLAIIDLGCGNSSMAQLSSIFSALGFVRKGGDYIAEKINDFSWFCADECYSASSHDALPQIVIADFRINELSKQAKKVICKYAAYQQEFNQRKFHKLLKAAEVKPIVDFIQHNLMHRAWPLPSVGEYNTVLQENELMAWVLLFGRTINHFGIPIYLYAKYNDLNAFNDMMLARSDVEINSCNGCVKGGADCGIAQSSTLGAPCMMRLQDGVVKTRGGFMEFVWRYPKVEKPSLWNDYYTGFFANNASKVIESLYV